MSTTFAVPNPLGESLALCQPTESSERDLVRRLQAGEEHAYRDFVGRFGARIFRLGYGILANREDAEEITQRVVVNVFLTIGNFAGRSSLFTWVYRIAVNESYSMLRTRRRMASFETYDTDSSVSAELQIRDDGGPRWDTVVMQRDYLNRLLAVLPENDRRLLLQREVEGLSISELSEATGMNENSVKSKLFRARQRVAQAAARLQ